MKIAFGMRIKAFVMVVLLYAMFGKETSSFLLSALQRQQRKQLNEAKTRQRYLKAQLEKTHESY